MNKLVDPAKLKKAIFPYLPMLGILVVQQLTNLRVSKRDARHYFHMFSRGRKWAPFFAMPPDPMRKRRPVSVIRSWRMGFKGSAVIAQQITLRSAQRAGLPFDRLVLLGEIPPTDLPVWFAIMDDGCST